MRILHVHDFYAPGNSRFAFDMDRLLAARGHEVHVLAAFAGMQLVEVLPGLGLPQRVRRGVDARQRPTRDQQAAVEGIDPAAARGVARFDVPTAVSRWIGSKQRLTLQKKTMRNRHRG